MWHFLQEAFGEQCSRTRLLGLTNALSHLLGSVTKQTPGGLAS